ncbi:unnamed protein product [Arctia plantaginis]|uniref:Uncharacterized protein n=1 Tax=Arctia plantaginis TaxID=874455 RepID=A0A8S0Z7D6_ARCPL|nr:unnamed protein product [Arctia plantaginis]
MDEVKNIVARQLIEVPQQVVPSPLPLKMAISFPPNAFVEEDIQTSQPWCQPEQPASIQSPPESRPATTPRLSYVEDHGVICPVRPTFQMHVVQPASAVSGRITRRRMRFRNRASHRRRVRLTHTEQAAQHFLQAEEFWRKFRAQQHQDYMDLRREQNRLRVMEIETQRRCHSLGIRALDVICKLVSKYSKE